MSRRVLVVDDEADIRAVVRLGLSLIAGWTVIEADHGEEALRLAARELPDAVLLDVMMPGMDGPEVAHRLKADPVTAHIPILLFTAKVLSAERAALDACPVAGILAKPFDPLQLAQQVSGLLGWSP